MHETRMNKDVSVSRCFGLMVSCMHGDENRLFREVEKLIQSYPKKVLPFEYYILILGFPTSKIRKGARTRAMRFKAYSFDKDGKLTDRRDRTIFQVARKEVKR